VDTAPDSFASTGTSSNSARLLHWHYYFRIAFDIIMRMFTGDSPRNQFPSSCEVAQLPRPTALAGLA
jgi:hypothetical protein